MRRNKKFHRKFENIYRKSKLFLIIPSDFLAETIFLHFIAFFRN